jgi:ATP-dependent DNA helicase RecG
VISMDSPVETVLGDTGTKAPKIAKGLGLRTVGELVHHLPRRYVRTRELTTVDTLEEGELLTVVGQIGQTRRREYTDRRTGRTAYRVDTVLRTDGPSLRMSFFAKKAHMADWHERRLPEGRRGIFQGKVGRFNGDWQLTNPQMVLMGTEGEDAAQLSLETLGELYPIYPLTKGVDTWDLQRAITFALAVLDEVPELLPEHVRAKAGLVDAGTALEWVHHPKDHSQVMRALQRLRFDEAIVTQLVLARRRRALAALGARPRAGRSGGLLDAFDARLPFELTAGQVEVGAEIDADLARERPMNRLLQGEVGSGKTLVALRAMLRVVDSGAQAALLAPTEVLAQQHHRSITAMLGDLATAGLLGGADEATAVELLTGSMTRTHVPAGLGRGRHRDRHARPARGPRGLRRPRPCRRRRAAPLRGRAARRPHRQGRHPAARAGDDRHPDPAHGGDDGLRRPRDLDADRAARRAGAGADHGGARRRRPALGRPGLAAGARGGRGRPPGLRGVPAHRRRRA